LTSAPVASLCRHECGGECGRAGVITPVSLHSWPHGGNTRRAVKIAAL